MILRNKILYINMAAFFILVTWTWISPSIAWSETYLHGDFTSQSQSCGTCHISHGASAEKLLAWGSNEAEFCYYCHSGSTDSIGSNYDVENGIINGRNGSNPSYAGGFKNSINLDSTVQGMVYSNTSMHNISTQIDGLIPGGSAWTGSFTCGSCHDPHAGGEYPSKNGKYKNPRLLRMQLLDDAANNVSRAVYMKIDYGNTNLPFSYGRGFNEWCGGCHDVFDTEGAVRTGAVGVKSGESSMDKFRHKMGVYIPDQVFSTSLADGLPIPTNTDGKWKPEDNPLPDVPQWRLSCLTCHRAHGTSVNVSVGFKRFTVYDSVYNYAADENQSTLLRLPERGVCYKCHGSAEYNLYEESNPNKYESGW